MAPRRTRRRTHKRKRWTAGLQPLSSPQRVNVNTTLTASSNHYWAVEGTSTSTFCKPSSISIRVASAIPTNFRVFLQYSNSPNPSSDSDWTSVWSSATTVISTTGLFVRLRAPRSLDPRASYRWGAVSSGTPVLAGWVTFSIMDPIE